jgi:diketogulonate reductase-like aldo/keto reductase
MPQFCFGVWQIPDADTATLVKTAIEASYRSIDAAAIYGNETGVGKGVRTAGVSREKLFLTTKLWNTEQGYDKTLKACDANLERLNLDFVDLYLIHWSMPQEGRYVDTWKAFVVLKKDGRANNPALAH